MGPADRNLKSDVTYWAPSAQNAYGERTWDYPQLFRGRWSLANELVRTSTGEEIVAKSVVHLSDDVVEGGWLAPGNQTDLLDPALAEGAAEVKAFQIAPDLRNVASLRKAFL